MTTPLNSDRHIILNIPKSKPRINQGLCYQENKKEMQVEKVQQILIRHRAERNSAK